MKHFFASLLVCLMFNLHAQEAIKIEEVIHVDSTAKQSELFNRGEHWVISAFKNPQKVIQLKDKEAGQIIAKGVFKYQSKFIWGASDRTKGVIDFTVKLFFKDGRYKYVLTDFIHNPYNGDSFGLITTDKEYPGKISLSTKGWRRKVWNHIKENIKKNSVLIITSLKQGMNKKVEAEDDNW